MVFDCFQNWEQTAFNEQVLGDKIEFLSSRGCFAAKKSWIECERSGVQLQNILTLVQTEKERHDARLHQPSQFNRKFTCINLFWCCPEVRPTVLMRCTQRPQGPGVWGHKSPSCFLHLFGNRNHLYTCFVSCNLYVSLRFVSFSSICLFSSVVSSDVCQFGTQLWTPAAAPMQMQIGSPNLQANILYLVTEKHNAAKYFSF